MVVITGMLVNLHIIIVVFLSQFKSIFISIITLFLIPHSLLNR